MKKKNLLALLICSIIIIPGFAGEGMWLPLLLKQLNEKEMQSMGMKISAEDIYSINKGSLKDAIVQFGGGCTAEIISAEGLLLTNHHCGYGQIQRHSSIEKNYVDDGFWAMNRKDELSCPGLTVMFIVSMSDVTKDVLKGVKEDMSPAEKQAAMDQNINALNTSFPHLADQEILIRSFYKGNQFYLFVTETYRDVRLVGAPPAAIGNFGVDTDNWVWPRHTGDFSMFRIYADKHNRPADYSEDNIPYTPKHFLPISLDGVKPGDFTMVFGFPGRTDEYLPSNAIEQVVNIADPVRVGIREKVLGIMHEYMTQDKATKIKYVSKAAGVANYWKKMKGEQEGLIRTNAIQKKRAYEARFVEAINANPQLKDKYKNVLPAIQAEYKKSDQWVAPQIYYSEFVNSVELLNQASRAAQLIRIAENNDANELNKRKKSFSDMLAGFFKNYDVRIDKGIFGEISKMYVQNLDPMYVFNALKNLNPTSDQLKSNIDNLYAQTVLINQEQLQRLLSGDDATLISTLKNDPAYLFYSELVSVNSALVAPNNAVTSQKINELMQQFMQAQMEAFPSHRFYPDANSTLRITYGKVDGYQPRDAVYYEHQTFLEGVMEKYVPGDYEFDVPAKLIELYRSKDYGSYSENGRMPIAFIAANHTTGGNSGSPALDAYGNLVGLNFDRVWEGTMSDLNYDASICRNIMVDARYILFLIDKYAGASHLIKEMKLVHPKTTLQKSKQKNKKKLSH